MDRFCFRTSVYDNQIQKQMSNNNFLNTKQQKHYLQKTQMIAGVSIPTSPSCMYSLVPLYNVHVYYSGYIHQLIYIYAILYFQSM